MPVRARRRHLPEQPEIHPFVDDPEKAESRMRDMTLVVWICLRHSRTGKVIDIHAARKREHVRMTVTLAFEQRLTACENDVGSLQQLLFPFAHRGGRVSKQGEFV